jgi:hypothetical protein
MVSTTMSVLWEFPTLDMSPLSDSYEHFYERYGKY